MNSQASTHIDIGQAIVSNGPPPEENQSLTSKSQWRGSLILVFWWDTEVIPWLDPHDYCVPEVI
jgi:hypothetical protein